MMHLLPTHSFHNVKSLGTRDFIGSCSDHDAARAALHVTCVYHLVLNLGLLTVRLRGKLGNTVVTDNLRTEHLQIDSRIG